MSYEAKGKDYAAQANKKLKGWGMFGNKYEDAAELLEKAANQFKLGKAWRDAGDVWVQLAGVHEKLDSKHEVASSWAEAASCFKKVSSTDAIRCLHKAVETFQDMGRLQMAARHLKSIAELQEEQGFKDDCLDSYRQAADLFAGEDSTSEANKCRLKVALISAEQEKYTEAIQIFEDVARTSLDSNLLKYSAKGYLLNAGICHLARGRQEDIFTAIDRYCDLDHTFDNSRECKLLKDLANAVESGDGDVFAGAVADFDSMTRLDPWKTALLLKAKKLITSREVDEDDLT
mmetsp:Transcript_26984/g.76041  ORF Transcript_26984/g.76041 Transcript_26984/m.76041 type:complete len:289 (-) Transcript_26984:231-1097(-)